MSGGPTRSLLITHNKRLKDYIKNCLRQPSMVNEFYLYYEDINKRLDMKYKMLSKRSIRNKTYMKYLYLLEECEFESVETIYSSLRRIIGKVYILRYENIKITDEHPVLNGRGKWTQTKNLQEKTGQVMSLGYIPQFNDLSLL